MKSSTHKRKIGLELFDAVCRLGKNFAVLRIDPRVGPVEVGDTLVFGEWDGEQYTGFFTVRKAAYVLVGHYQDLIPQDVQVVGFCVPDKNSVIFGNPQKEWDSVADEKGLKEKKP